MNSAQRKIIFLHISKTAGTTFRKVAEKNYGSGEFTSCYGNPEEKERCLHRAMAEKRRAIFGHLDFSYFKAVDTQPYELVSMLREPVAQVVSHYIHLSHSKDPRHIAYAGRGFEDFLGSYAGQNWQCQYLSSFKEKPQALHPKEEMLREALRNLEEKLFFCGLSERFDDSLIFLRDQFHWKNTAYGRQNISGDQKLTEELKRKFRKEIIAANQADMELYQRAVSLFEEKLKRVKFYFFKKVRHRMRMPD